MSKRPASSVPDLAVPDEKKNKDAEVVDLIAAPAAAGKDSPAMSAAASATGGGLCESLKRCVVRWNLLPPFTSPNDDGAWQDYYRERALLEFRHSHFWLADGNELPSRERCYGFDDTCKRAGTC